MKIKHPARVILPLLVMTAASSWAYGQAMQMPMGEGMMGCPMMDMMGMRGMMGPGSIAAQVEGRLAYVKAEIAITEAQTPAWKQYEDAVRSRTSGMQGMRQEMMVS
jgi:LTXXQ motif family protein